MTWSPNGRRHGRCARLRHVNLRRRPPRRRDALSPRGRAHVRVAADTELLLDYRRYQVLAEPFTLALRGIHVGRFGSDAEDSRSSSLFIGFPNLVRGYDINSFDVTECQPVSEGGCRLIDDLLGSRMLVGNAELRFPLVGAFKGEFDYSPLPIEGFLFADTGVA